METDEADSDYIYVCGVSAPYAHVNNFHAPLRYKFNNVARMTTYNGYEIEFKNAEILPIPALPENYRGLFQPKTSRGTSAAVVMSDELKSLISFRHLNLMEPWPMRGLFDAIFCRNVMIYFDGPTKMTLIDRFVGQLKPGGWLYIGHSESLLGTHQNLSHAGRTIYRRSA